MFLRVNLLLIIILLGYFLHVEGQSLPMGFTAQQEFLRREQLKGHVDSMLSFNLRPIYLDRLVADSAVLLALDGSSFRAKFGKGKGRVELLPLQFTNQLNTSTPYGWNDGLMIPARGYQTYLSAGFFFKYGVFQAQFRPEAVWAANVKYEGFPTENPGLLQSYFAYQYNRIDQPDRLAKGSYSRLNIGQSYVGFSAAGLFLGLSSENLTWGPGKYNSLLLSNNAPGFSHLTLKTNKAINIGIGTLESQLYVGKLIGSGVGSDYFNSSFYQAPRDDWRYFSGFMMTYSPKGVRGLSLGAAKVVQQYFTDTKEFGNYLPIFTNFFRRKNNFSDDLYSRDHLMSIFARWNWRKANAEVYFEFGRNDSPYNPRALLISLDHSRAFLYGFSKLIDFPRIDQSNIQFSFEVTQLEQSVNYVIIDALNWYTHYQVRQGYTNRGQVIGAGIGPGSNSQSLEVSWVRELDKVGILITRKVNNNDFFRRLANADANRRPWVDLSFGLLLNKQVGRHLLISSNVSFVNSLNYQWKYSVASPDQVLPSGEYKFNLFSNVKLLYTIPSRSNEK
jgi:hypothetical protein